MAIYNLNKLKPRLPSGDFWIAENAHVIGDVRLGVNTGIWFGAVLRGDNEPIIIGDKTNVQENSVIHVDEGVKVMIGSGCTIGHKALLHGCKIGSNSLIGMGAIILNNSIIGSNCLVGAGSLITEGNEFPDGKLILGSPAKVIRDLTDNEINKIKWSANHYVENIKIFKKGLIKN
jgi:carbonic anhydrase/acetyltransferase-like protein (isoleucine patch superfamily)